MVERTRQSEHRCCTEGLVGVTCCTIYVARISRGQVPFYAHTWYAPQYLSDAADRNFNFNTSLDQHARSKSWSKFGLEGQAQGKCCGPFQKTYGAKCCASSHPLTLTALASCCCTCIMVHGRHGAKCNGSLTALSRLSNGSLTAL